MFLSKENLALYSVPDPKDVNRPDLSGVYVDLRREVTAATDGKRLIEVTSPGMDPKKYPVKDVSLATEAAEPFILPAKTAQEILKVLPKGKNDQDPIRYAAVLASKKGKARSIVVTDGRKPTTFTFEPVEATFPDYVTIGTFPKGEPRASLSVDPDLLRETLGQAAMGGPMTIHLFKDRIILEARAADGTKSRAVLMCLQGEAIAYDSAKAKAVEVPDPEPEPEQKGGPRPYARPAHRRRWQAPSAEVGQRAPGTPTPEQRAFYTYLVYRHGEDLTPEVFEETDISEKITALKETLSRLTDDQATYAQWRKLYHLLAGKVETKEVSRILAGVSDRKSASSLIGEWLAKDAPKVDRSQTK